MKPGPQVARQFSAPIGGAKTLLSEGETSNKAS